tara:strand:+ start:611 stop:955 length:345 start_codon:yes stop_codon:yes gene_type:complete
MITFQDAVFALVPNAQMIHNESKIVDWHDTRKQPTEEAIEAKLTELKNAEPMRLLRLERNQKLAKTDWWCCSDRTPTKAQLDYRTALRDLPSTASPSLEENGTLTGVTWPTKPE